LIPPAEVPKEKIHVLIVESTHGISCHDPRKIRESRFTEKVHQIVGDGGKCLLPVLALGRAEEILLILEEYWAHHPEI
jgi:cleavage and polyadenylation specificity factor subunit 3